MEKELLELLQTQDFEGAASLANKYESETLAQVLQETEQEYLPAFCRALDSEVLADALLLVDKTLQETLINGLRDDELEKVLDEMSVDETVDILEDTQERMGEPLLRCTLLNSRPCSFANAEGQSSTQDRVPLP